MAPCARVCSMWTLLVLASAAPGKAGLDVLMLTPDRDNSIYQGSDSNSNGAGPLVYSGRTGTNTEPDGLLRRALFHFDLGGIPKGSEIVDVSLTLVMSSGGDQAPRPYTLHAVTSEWGEAGSSGGGEGAPAQLTDATWSHRLFPTDTWTSPGGDFVAAPSASHSISANGTYVIAGVGLVVDVQAWLDGAMPNHGWILRGDEINLRTAKRFVSKEGTEASARPMLTITYDPKPMPSETASWSDLKGRYAD